MTTNPTGYLDDFMDRLITVPNDVNRNLRLIRKLDKRAQQLNTALNTLQNKFLNSLKQLKQKKITQLTPSLKQDLQNIQKKQKQYYGYCKQKKQISDQLLQQITQLTFNLQKQVRSKNKDQQDLIKRKKQKFEASKNNNFKSNKDFQYISIKQPQYCICGGGSYGQMVGCDNPYCQRQWFHISCIDQKTLPQKYYCKQCQPIKDKTKNPISRQFLISKQNNN